MSELVKFSRFAHIYRRPDKEVVALYHSLDLATVFVPPSAAWLVNDLGQTIDISSQTDETKSFVQTLRNLGFVVNIDENEDVKIDKIVSDFRPALSTMYLILTDHCNLACKYCFVVGNFPEKYERSRMPWNVAKAAIDLFAAQRDQGSEGQIWLYGGEPFIEKALVFKCLDYIRATDPSVKAVIVTNGTLIDNNTAKRLCEYNVELAVSIDGPKDVNDQMRVRRNGRSSFDAAMRGISALRAAGKDFDASCTLAEHNVDQIVDVSRWIREETGASSICMNLLMETPRDLVEESYVTQASQGLIDNFMVAREDGVVESRIMRKVDAFVQQRLYPKDCAACGHQFVVSPEGRIGICHEGLGARKFFISSVFEPFDFHCNPDVIEWSKRSPLSMAECQGCPALGICGGGCPFGAMLRHGSIWAIDRRFCTHAKLTLEWLIWDLFDKMQVDNGAD
jgi:uncharacterized protein